MKKVSRLSPVLLELIIVILFFALSSTVVLRLVAAAAATSRLSEQRSEALIAATRLMERAKADPLGWHAAETVITHAGDAITLRTAVAGRAAGAGTLYAITVEAHAGSTTLLTLAGSQYIAGEGAG